MLAKQISFINLILLFVLGVFAAGEQLACSIEQLPLSLIHLDQSHRKVR
jgi:hypothetical protein